MFLGLSTLVVLSSFLSLHNFLSVLNVYALVCWLVHLDAAYGMALSGNILAHCCALDSCCIDVAYVHGKGRAVDGLGIAIGKGYDSLVTLERYLTYTIVHFAALYNNRLFLVGHR